MNQKILAFAVAFVTVALLTAPVMAKPAQRIPVTVVLSNVGQDPYEKQWLTNGGIVHNIGGPRWGTAILTIEGHDPLEGTYSELANSNLNTKTGALITCDREGKTVLTFDDGSFEGKIHHFITLDAGWLVIARRKHGVLQGSGVFEGCTLTISQDWELGDGTPTYTGFLLVAHPPLAIP